jgi:hypothetical protein
MNVPLCPHCWCPHAPALPCGARIARVRWHPGGANELQRLADHAERITIDRFLRLRSAG